MASPFNMWSAQQNQPTTQASVGTQIKVWFDSLPLLTRSLFVVCTSIYVVSLFAGFDNLGAVCLSPSMVVQHFQVYRLLTAVVFHVGILHLAFNMLAFVGTGKALERQMGTVQFSYLILLFSLVADVMYIAISYAVYYAPLGFGEHVLYSCAIGLSGVIFGLIVVDTDLSGTTTRSIMGWFTVPAKAYPWCLMLFWQLLMPSVSFLGHLCGVLVGQFYVWGWLSWLKLPASMVSRIEESRLLSRLYRMDSFIAHTGTLPTSYPASSTAQQYPASSNPFGGVSFRDWLRRGWAPIPTSDPSASDTSQPDGNTAQGAFAGRPYTLAGASSNSQPSGTGSPGNAAPSHSGPPSEQAGTPSNSTLAAAAEARLSRVQARGNSTDKSGPSMTSSGKASESGTDGGKAGGTSSEGKLAPPPSVPAITDHQAQQPQRPAAFLASSATPLPPERVPLLAHHNTPDSPSSQH